MTLHRTKLKAARPAAPMPAERPGHFAQNAVLMLILDVGFRGLMPFRLLMLPMTAL